MGTAGMGWLIRRIFHARPRMGETSTPLILNGRVVKCSPPALVLPVPLHLTESDLILKGDARWLKMWS